ncbi:MAG: hypothetical protein AAFP08_08705 [Bacteroidota bacterium]
MKGEVALPPGFDKEQLYTFQDAGVSVDTTPVRGPGNKPSPGELANGKDDFFDSLMDKNPSMRDPSVKKGKFWVAVLAVLGTLILVFIARRNGWL